MEKKTTKIKSLRIWVKNKNEKDKSLSHFFSLKSSIKSTN